MKIKEKVDVEEIVVFLGLSVPPAIVQHEFKKVTYLEEQEPRDLLPEKGPFLFFAERPIIILENSETTIILASMNVKPEFCEGHFEKMDNYESRPNLPLYFIGGAAGQLCAIFTAVAKSDPRYMPLATDGSAKSLGDDLIDLGSQLLFIVSLVERSKRGFEFKYEVCKDNHRVASGAVSSIAVPKSIVVKKHVK
ncbi:MAG: hypothetical protein WCV41_00425 [Patescibacteria group bacterium]